MDLEFQYLTMKFNVFICLFLQIEVWWAGGHTSRCYPQDLYKVGEYDSDEGELWDDVSSEDSWETQSEHSIINEER